MNRFPNLVSIYTSFQKTGIHLMTMGKSGYQSPIASDDLGYFLYVTLIAHIFSLSILNATYVFFYINVGLIIGSMLLAFGVLGNNFFERIFVFLGTMRLLMPLYCLSHVYIAYASVFSIVPFVLLCDHKSLKKTFLIGIFLGGIILSALDTVRMYASLPVLLFLLIYIIGTKQWNKKTKYYAIVLFLIGYSLPIAYFNRVIQKRNVFLIQQGKVLPDKTRHLFWHNVYMGLGFLYNNENISWSDSCAAKKALEINSKAHYPSLLYEKTIRNEIFRLCKEKRYFIVTTMFAKLGIIFYFFLIYFGVIGLVVSWFYPKPWYIELSFFLVFITSMLPGLLTLPTTSYLMGFITCTIVYTLYSYLYACKKGLFKDLKKFFYAF